MIERIQEEANRLEKLALSAGISFGYADRQTSHERDEVEKLERKAYEARKNANVAVMRMLSDEQLNTLANAVIEGSKQLDYTLGAQYIGRNAPAIKLREMKSLLRGE